MKWVRPFLSIMGFTALITGFFMGKIDADAIVGVTVFIVTWWYKSRDDEKKIQ